MWKSVESLKKTWNSLKLFEKLSIFLIIFLIAVVGIFMSFARQPIKSKSRAVFPKLTPQVVDASKRPVSLNEALTTRGVFMPQEQPVKKVSTEIIYNKDLNYILYTFFAKDFDDQIIQDAQAKDIVEVKKEALDYAVNQSLILQKGNEQKIITIAPITWNTIFNTINKDFGIRNKIATAIEDKIDATAESVSGAIISVWYHNVEMPPLVTKEGKTLAEARQMAYDKITDLQIKVRKKAKEKESLGQSPADALETAFREVGQAFYQDCKDQKDPVIKLLEANPVSAYANAYYEFSEKTKEETLFSRQILNSVFWNLKPGKMSGNIEIPHTNSTPGSSNEEFFALVAKFDKTNIGQKTTAELIQSQKNSAILIDCTNADMNCK